MSPRYYEEWESSPEDDYPDPEPIYGEDLCHCVKCQWEGYPILDVCSTPVPYGDMYVDLQDCEPRCPECNELYPEEGPLPVMEEEV